MPDPAWQNPPTSLWAGLVENVLAGVEPDEEKRAPLHRRLRENGTLSLLYAGFRCGGDWTSIGRILHHLARQERGVVR